MAITFDHELLVRLGLGQLHGDEAAEMLSLLQETLQDRVGGRIADRCSDSELAELEAAVEAGEAEASEWLDRHAPDHREVVREEFDALCAEVAAVAEVMLAELHGPQESVGPEVAPTEPAGPVGPGPTLVGSENQACVVVSPSAGTVVGANVARDQLYARRGELPPVLLQLPADHHVDATMLWCTDEGEVRLRAGDVDLRWRLPDSPGATVLEAGESPHLPRPALPWTDVEIRGSGFVEFVEGPWHVDDGQFIEVTNLETERRLWLEQLHPGSHSNAVHPHFTPDGRHLVAVHNARDEPTAAGLSACSVDYLGSVELPPEPEGEDEEARRVPWEHRVRPNDGVALGEVAPMIRPEDLVLESIGYDASATRAALADRRAVHLMSTADWSSIGTIVRPDRSAITVQVPLPIDGAPMVAWADRSVVAAAGDGTVWRVDPHAGPEPELVAEATSERAPVAVSRLGQRVVLVHADRRIVTVDPAGSVSTEQLPGIDAPVAADVTADGRLLVATRSGLELWAGGVLHAQARVPGPPIVGVSACARMSEWSLLWRDDGSIASARCTGRRIRVVGGRLPHLRTEGSDPTANTALMVDVDEWFLAQSRTRESGVTATVVVAPGGWIDIPARCLALVPSAGLVAVGTQRGVEFITLNGGGLRRPRAVDLGAAVESVAAGACPRSLAVGTSGAIWMIRLLV